jgi:hypothetical protein
MEVRFANQRPVRTLRQYAPTLRHSTAASLHCSWLTDPAFAGSVSPSYGECQATEKRVSGFSSLESNEVAKFFSG